MIKFGYKQVVIIILEKAISDFITKNGLMGHKLVQLIQKRLWLPLTIFVNGMNTELSLKVKDVLRKMRN